MRRTAEFDFGSRPEGGGFIDIRGTISVPGRHEVRLTRQGHDFMSLEVSVIQS